MFNFLDWLAKKLEYKPVAVIHVEANGNFDQEIVGESHYQRNLGMLNKVWLEERRENPLLAELFCENDNEHDKKAILVKIKGHDVGYLSRDDARLYRKRIKKAGLGEVVVSCDAKITGGTKGKTMFGVWLDLPLDEL